MCVCMCVSKCMPFQIYGLVVCVCGRDRRILLEKVADSARKAVKLAEPYKPYGGQFLEFCSISLSTYQTCMNLTRKSTEFCQFFCRQNPLDPSLWGGGGGCVCVCVRACVCVCESVCRAHNISFSAYEATCTCMCYL